VWKKLCICNDIHFGNFSRGTVEFAPDHLGKRDIRDKSLWMAGRPMVSHSRNLATSCRACSNSTCSFASAVLPLIHNLKFRLNIVYVTLLVYPRLTVFTSRFSFYVSSYLLSLTSTAYRILSLSSLIVTRLDLVST
jgi:hypothetical protein